MDFSKILELHVEMTRSDACLGIELSLVTLETGCNGCAQKGQLGPPGEEQQGTCDCLGDSLFNSTFGRR